MIKNLFIVSIFLVFFFGWPLISQAVAPEVKIFDYQGNFQSGFSLFEDSYQGTINLAVGDLGTDGIDEIVVNRGPLYEPKVEALRRDGSKIFDFLAYSSNFLGGVFLDLADLDGDGRKEIITGAGFSGGPHVRSFKDDRHFRSFFAFNPSWRNGVRVVGADFGGDGKSEIVALSNLNQDGQIRILDNHGSDLFEYKFDEAGQNGLVAAKIKMGNNKYGLALAFGYSHESKVMIFGSDMLLSKEFIAFNDFEGGLNLAVGDVNGDGMDEIIVAPSFGGGPHIKVFSLSGELISEFFAFDKSYRGGVKVAVGQLDNDLEMEIVAVPERIYNQTRNNYKYIEVDLSKQELYFWQNGTKLGKFMISSGTNQTPTPKGEFAIYRKRPSVLMSGPDYYLPGVPWVTSFSGAYTIHGTYWHDNFGNQMSHGCVNMRTPEAKFIYDWSDIGTPVIVY